MIENAWWEVAGGWEVNLHLMQARHTVSNRAKNHMFWGLRRNPTDSSWEKSSPDIAAPWSAIYSTLRDSLEKLYRRQLEMPEEPRTRYLTATVRIPITGTWSNYREEQELLRARTAAFEAKFARRQVIAGLASAYENLGGQDG